MPRLAVKETKGRRESLHLFYTDIYYKISCAKLLAE